MRTKTFRPYDQDTLLLMPPSVRDWVATDSLPAFISDIVDELDLAPFLAAHDEPRGMPPYHPRLMLKVLLYGYATGVTSSRKLEARLAADVGFMYLAGQSRPDHKTISSFRRRHLAAFGALFLQVLVLCGEAGLVKLGRVALDGTKVKANASKHKAMSYGRMAEREAALEAEVRAILDEAEAVDAAEDQLYGDARGDELPPELRTREGRLARIREAKAALEQQARERTGNPEAVPEPKVQRNFTDPQSRIMLSKPDGWVQGYNVGIAVDAAAQVIVATSVTVETTDTRGLPDLVDQIKANTGRSPRRLLADAGYCSEDNLTALEERGIDGLHRGRSRSSRGAGAAAAAGSDPGRALASGADEPQTPHQGWPPPLRATQGDRRAGLRPDQGGPGLPAVQPPGARGGAGRMAPRRSSPQPRQAVYQRSSGPGTPRPSDRQPADIQASGRVRSAGVWVRRSGSSSARICPRRRLGQAISQRRSPAGPITDAGS